MRRFLRILLYAATVGSLMMCAATAALWVRSYDAAWLIVWPRAAGEVHWGASRGRVWAYRAVEAPGAARPAATGVSLERYAPAPEPRQWGYGPPFIPAAFEAWGFAYAAGSYLTVPGRTVQCVIVPCWAVCAASGAGAAVGGAAWKAAEDGAAAAGGGRALPGVRV